MKNLNKLVLSAALLMTSLCGSLQADTFHFSYIFDTDDVGSDNAGVPGEFYGTLTGNQVGDNDSGYVTDVVVTALWAKTYDTNGDPVFTDLKGLSSLFTSSWYSDPDADEFNDLSHWNAYGSAVVSFDRDQNNFLFTPDDILDPDWNGDFTSYAYLLNAAAGGGGVVGAGGLLSSGADILAYDGGEHLGKWELENLTNSTPVPDGGTTVALLGLALVGIAALRRRPSDR